MPFLALQLYQYEQDDKDTRKHLLYLLVFNALAWVLSNVLFFCTIDLSFLNTFVSLETASQTVIKNFRESTDESVKFFWAFEFQKSYTKPIKAELKEWVENNINIWTLAGESWFNLLLIPTELLPAGSGLPNLNRRRSISIQEIFGLPDVKKGNTDSDSDGDRDELFIVA